MQAEPAAMGSGFCSQPMKNWLSSLKSTDISEDFLQNLAGIEGVLSHPAGLVGIGADGDDFPA